MTKIITRIFGGIGNQLFCYAAARRLALVNSAELVIDDVSGFTRDYDYRRQYQLDHFNIPCRKATSAERLEPFSRLRRALKRRINQRRPLIERNYIQQQGADFDPRLLDVKPSGVVYVEGYWQSEGYFKDVEETLRIDLQITPPMDAVNLHSVSRIQACQAVAVHVRHFDASSLDRTNNAPPEYYRRALARMEALVPNAHYFVFSDCPAYVRASISLPTERVTYLTHNLGDENAYADLWLMTRCKHFIIANSTFSWWGAWMATVTEKIVIAPGLQMREGRMRWGFDGLLPREWIVL